MNTGQLVPEGVAEALQALPLPDDLTFIALAGLVFFVVANLALRLRTDVFILGAALLSMTMLLGALLPGFERLEALQQSVEEVENVGFIVNDEKLRGFQDMPGVNLAYDDNRAFPFMVINADGPKLGEISDAGAHVLLAPPIADVFTDQEMQVSIWARQNPSNPSQEFAATYIVLDTGNPPWRRFQPTPEYSEFTFRWRPPEQAEPAGALVGIWPDTSGGDGGIIVREVRVELVENLVE